MKSQDVKSTINKMDDRIIQIMNKHVLSGMSIGIVHDSEVIYAKGFGLANAERKLPVTTKTIFRIASISKTFTAIGLMQLWEKGLFDLDDPVNKHLKSYRIQHRDPQAPPVTIRQLLTHTSGIGEMRDPIDLVGELIPGNRIDKYRPGEVIPSLREHYDGVLEPDVYPLKKWAYANHAFASIGQLIEDISGQPFPDYMLDHVFKPLGMSNTDYLYSDRVKDQLAEGYVNKKGYLKKDEFTMFTGLGAGSVFSSVDDMVLYLAALMNGGNNKHGSIIKPETLQLMMSPHYQEHPHLAAMGLGFFLESLDGHQAAWHGGSLEGFNSALWVAPKDKLGLILFANSNTRAIYYEAEGILRDLLGLPDINNRLPVPGISNSPHLWSELVGQYQAYPGFNSNARIWMNFGGEMEVYVKGNQLMLRSFSGSLKKGIPIYPVDNADPLVFENVTDGKVTQLVFKRDKEGVVNSLNMSALAFYQFFKVPQLQSLKYKSRMLLGSILGVFLIMIGLKNNKKR